MNLFSKFTWIVILGYGLYETIARYDKSKRTNSTIKKLETVLYSCTGIISIILFDLLFTSVLSDELLFVFILICIVLQLSVIVTIQYFEIKTKAEKEKWKNRLIKNLVLIICWLIIFVWMLNEHE